MVLYAFVTVLCDGASAMVDLLYGAVCIWWLFYV